MRYKLRLLKPVAVADGFGGSRTEYHETHTVWAERQKVSPRFVEEVGELFSDLTVEFNIRDIHEVDERWRVEQLGGHLYTVANIIPNRERGMRTLRCERVNT